MKDSPEDTINALLELNAALTDLLQEMLRLLIMVSDEKGLDAPTTDQIHKLARGVIEKAKRS